MGCTVPGSMGALEGAWMFRFVAFWYGNLAKCTKSEASPLVSHCIDATLVPKALPVTLLEREA